MNCRRAERLLPLHAGGDLAEGRERAALLAHLELCEGCRRAAFEWAEELRLLRLEDAPEFGADFFDPIRRDVMREIRAAEVHARPALSASLLARLLGPKPLAYAAALALVCALALLSALRLARAPRPSEVAGDGIARSLGKQLSFEHASKKRTTDETVAHDDSRVSTLVPGLATSRHRAAPRAPVQARESATPKTPRRENDEPSSPSTAHVLSPTQTPPTAVAVAPPDLPNASELLASVKDEREMLKIDLRTGDPDVRIIWFSPQPGTQASPRKLNDKR